METVMMKRHVYMPTIFETMRDHDCKGSEIQYPPHMMQDTMMPTRPLAEREPIRLLRAFVKGDGEGDLCYVSHLVLASDSYVWDAVSPVSNVRGPDVDPVEVDVPHSQIGPERRRGK